VGRIYTLNQGTYAATLANNMSLQAITIAADLRGNVVTAIENGLLGILLGSSLTTYNKTSGSSINSIGISDSSYDNVAVTQDGSKAAIWDSSNGKVKFYGIPNLALLYTWTPTVSSPNSLSSVTFSQDSQLAILETDAHNPLLIINLTTFTTFHSFSISDTILYTHFLNSSNDFVVVFKPSGMQIIDLTTLTLYQINMTISV
jgi:hypothetical protein